MTEDHYKALIAMLIDTVQQLSTHQCTCDCDKDED